MFVEPADPTFEQKGDETKPSLRLEASESPFSRKKYQKSQPLGRVYDGSAMRSTLQWTPKYPSFAEFIKSQ